MKAFFYLARQYFKSFLIVTLGLTFAATLIDFIQHFGNIDGFNRKILYLYYTFCDLFLFIYPIGLVFGAIIAFSNLVWKNHFLALLSFGYEKKRLIKPYLAVFFLVYLTVIALNFTKFAYSGDSARAILDKRQLFKSLDKIFFKYNNSFVFAEKMDVVGKEFDDVTLYIKENNRLKQILHFKKAKFKNGKWIATNIEKRTLEYNKTVPTGYKTEIIKEEEILQGYYPKVVRLLYEGKRMGIGDGIKALALLKKQHIDSSKIKASLYTKIIMPLFAPFLIILIFAYLPLHKRFLSRAVYLLLTMGLTLIVWTVLYSVNMLSINGVINPDFGQPLIIMLLFAITAYIWFRKKNF